MNNSWRQIKLTLRSRSLEFLTYDVYAPACRSLGTRFSLICRHGCRGVAIAVILMGCQSKRFEETKYTIQVAAVATPAVELELQATPVPVEPNLVPTLLATPRVQATKPNVERTPTAKQENAKIQMGELWVQIQFLLEKNSIAKEDVGNFGLESRMIDQGVSSFDPKIWIPKLENARTQLQSFELTATTIVKRYERILSKLLSSNLEHEKVTLYQDNLQILMSNLEEKSLVDVNKSLNEIETEIKSLSQTP